MSRAHATLRFAFLLQSLDDDLLAALLERLRAELAARGKFDAANFVERARRCTVPDELSPNAVSTG